MEKGIFNCFLSEICRIMRNYGIVNKFDRIRIDHTERRYAIGTTNRA